MQQNSDETASFRKFLLEVAMARRTPQAQKIHVSYLLIGSNLGLLLPRLVTYLHSRKCFLPVNFFRPDREL